jgi:hypothetical protein
MDNFKILIRLLTNRGDRSDIAFDFDAAPDSPPLAAAARACLERADAMSTSGDISQLDISVCDSQHKQLEAIRIRTCGSRATFERENSLQVESLPGFTLDPEDVEMFHLAAHGLLAERQSRR